MTVNEAALLIEASNTITHYETQHKTEVWSEFYDFAEKMMPIVEVGLKALASEQIEPWEEAYKAMDREIERVFGIDLESEVA